MLKKGWGKHGAEITLYAIFMVVYQQLYEMATKLIIYRQYRATFRHVQTEIKKKKLAVYDAQKWKKVESL